MLTKRVRNVSQNSAFGTSSGGTPGEVLEYCIDYRNAGGAALQNFVIQNLLPTSLGGYDSAEPGAANGFGLRLERGVTAMTTTYLSSAADAGRRRAGQRCTGHPGHLADWGAWQPVLPGTDQVSVPGRLTQRIGHVAGHTVP